MYFEIELCAVSFLTKCDKLRTNLKNFPRFSKKIVESHFLQIIPKFEAFLKFKNQSQLLRIPKCLAFKMDGENDFIALQDVSQFGFGPISRQNVIAYEQFKYMVEAMARFHSVSLGFKLEKPLEFERLASRLSETYFTDHLYETWYEGFHVSMIQRE